MSRTLQFRRLGTATLANTIGANGELIINSTNKALTVHDGSTPGGFALLNQTTDNNIDQTARNTANTAFDNTIVLLGVNTTQNTNITTATNLAQNAYNNSNTKFSSSGGQITGNVIIVGDLDVTDNTVVVNTMEANNAIIDGTLKTGLAARSSVVLPHLIAQFASNSATYVQTNSQNINPQGSADYVVTADNGTDTDFYIDLGLHGSQSFDKILTPYDGYLFVQGSTIGQAGGNLIIGTTSSFTGLETKFVAGGYNANNVVMKLGTYGANVVGNLAVTGTINVNNVLTVSTSSPAASPSITVITTQNQELRLQAVSNTWSYYANGTTIFPGGSQIRRGWPGRSGIPFDDSHWFMPPGGSRFGGIMSADGQQYIQTNNLGGGISIGTNYIGSTSNIWNFGIDGTLTFPDSTIQTTAWTGSAIDQTARNTANTANTRTVINGLGNSKLDFNTYGANSAYLTTTNDDSTALFMGAVSAELYANTDVSIRANTGGTSKTWTFGQDGTTTFPTNITINYSGNNVQFPRIITDSGKAFSIQGQGANGSAALAWSIDPNVDSQYSAVGVSRGGGDSLAKVILTAGNTTSTLKVWTFNETGAFTFPDSSVQTGGSISLVELKALVANSATYAAFQSAIASL
jgi:hypothetical protein